MDHFVSGKTLTVKLSGRIDSGNAESTERELNLIVAENPAESVVLDAEGLEYLSSAGLRVILRLKKAKSDLSVVNVSADVYDIFEMTGFTQLMKIEKAFRRISVDGCEVIGQGANGKVYRIDKDTIVKVYLNPDSLEDIRRERELAKKAFVLGIPTAISYDIARVGDGFGTVFELLNAKSIAKLIATEPQNTDTYIGVYVDLLKKIHATAVKKGEMPDMKATAVGWAEFLTDYLDKDVADKLLKMVKEVPETERLMHGDYHIKNVMIQDGETLLIDMDTLCMGHPIFELGSMFNAYEGFSSLDHSISQSFLGVTHETAEYIWNKSLSLYLGTEDKVRIKEVKDKAMIIGFTRLLRRSIKRYGLNDPEKKTEIEYFRKNLTDLVRSVDTLEF